MRKLFLLLSILIPVSAAHAEVIVVGTFTAISAKHYWAMRDIALQIEAFGEWECPAGTFPTCSPAMCEFHNGWVECAVNCQCTASY